MDGFSFENQGTQTYLVYTVEENDSLDSMSLGMITNNNIPGLAVTSFSQMDTQRFIRYNITSKVSIKDVFSGVVNRKRLLSIFLGITDALITAQEYMIEPNSILLDLNYIFADVSSFNTTLLCLPVEGKMQEIDLGTFFKNIIFSTKYDENENNEHVTRIINYLNSAPTFSLVRFKEVLENLQEKQQPKPRPAAEEPVQCRMEEPSKPVPPITKPKQEVFESQPVKRKDEVQETTREEPPRKASNDSVPAPRRTDKPSSKPKEKSSDKTGDSSEKKMTMLYLLQHYSKENAAIYKAQKESAKSGESSDKKEKLEKKVKKNTAAEETTFAVPGRENPSKPATADTPVARQTVTVGGSETPKHDLPRYGEGGTSRAPQQVQTHEEKPQQERIVPPLKTSETIYSQPSTPAVKSAGNYPASSGGFGDTVPLDGSNTYGATIDLKTYQDQQPSKPKPYLFREKNREKIPLDKPQFRIGREESYVDYLISDNPAVGRFHAEIVTKGDRYYITDANSKNHTYVDGDMIPPNQEREITNGSVILLADERFEFKLY